MPDSAFKVFVDDYHKVRKACVYNEIRRYIYTTNVVESLNSRIDYIRMKIGGYFQSISILEINLMIQIDGLKQGKWENP